MPTRKKRRHSKRKTYKRGGEILKSVETTSDKYVDSKIMPSTDNNGLFDKDKFVPSVKSPWLPRLNEAKYANNMLFGKKGKVEKKAMFIILNNEMEKQQTYLYNEIDLEAEAVKVAKAVKTATSKAATTAEKAKAEAEAKATKAAKAARVAARAAVEAKAEVAEVAKAAAAAAAETAKAAAAEEAEAAMREAEAAIRETRPAAEAYSNIFNRFLSKYFPNPGLPAAVGAAAGGAAAPEEIEKLIKKKTLWPKDQIDNITYRPGVFLNILKDVSIEEEKEGKEEKEKDDEEEEKLRKLRKLRKLIYKHRTRFYHLIDDKMVETFMNKVDTKYSSIYKKGDTTTYDNIRYVIMWILFKIDTEL
jgi:hypothetical protein